MSKNYAAGHPMGGNQYPIINAPAPFKAIGQYVNENNTASSVVTLTDNTTGIEVATGAAPAVIRWVPASDTQASVVAVAGATANYDHYVPQNSFRRFVVPIELQNNSQGYASMVGQRVAYGLYARVAAKSQGIGSVLLTEYGSSNSY